MNHFFRTVVSPMGEGRGGGSKKQSAASLHPCKNKTSSAQSMRCTIAASSITCGANDAARKSGNNPDACKREPINIGAKIAPIKNAERCKGAAGASNPCRSARANKSIISDTCRIPAY